MAPKPELYQKIKDQFIHLIHLGAYMPGEPLPSLRKVALDLGVNPNTVEKAYQSLADEGLIEIIPKKGAYVKAFDLKMSSDIESLAKMIERMKILHTDDEILMMIKDILRGTKK